MLRIIFILTLGLLFFVSCKSSKKAINESDKKETVSLQEKYAAKLGVDKKQLKNGVLLKFIDDWYGVPYKYGGKDKSGIDCSAFSCQLENTVYKKNVSATAQGLFDACQGAKLASLHEGDLIFFKIDSKKVSHVGVYITNNKFVHASTKRGITINDLNEDYYKKYFFAAGRIK